MTLSDDVSALLGRVANVASRELRSIVEACGYEHRGTTGGHHQYIKPGVRTLVIPQKLTVGTTRSILKRLADEIEEQNEVE